MIGGIILVGPCSMIGFTYAANQGLAGHLLAVAFLLPAFLGITQLVVGFQLQSFRPSTRIWAIVFCSLWLFFVPIGTIFGSACLWYLARPAAKYVFTPEYLEVIRRTPHVKFRTSSLSWAILAIVLLAIMGLLVAVSQ